MSYILTPLSLTHRISNLLLNTPGTYTFNAPIWATHINVTCVGGGGICGNSFRNATGRVRGGGGGGGGALAYTDTIPLNGNTIITARVANSNLLKVFSEEQTSFVALNSTVIVEASSGLAGGDLNTTSSSSSVSTTGGAGGIVLVGNGGNGKSGSGASSVEQAVRTTSPVMSWRKFEGGQGGGAGGYSNDPDNGGGGNGGSRSYRYLIGPFAAGYSFHSLVARFSGGGVGVFGKGSNGNDGGVQAEWDGNNSSQQQIDNYSIVNGNAGSNGIVRRYGGGMGGGARYISFSGGVSTWSEGPQTNGVGGNSQIFAGTGAVRIQFLSS